MRSHTPVYLQLAAILRSKIRSGELPPETVLPGEFELARQYKVGRAAVRQALGVLRTEALVVTMKGEGTKVRTWPARRLVAVGPDDVVTFRQTSPEERISMDIDEGIGLVVIERPGQEPELLPSDEVKITGR